MYKIILYSITCWLTVCTTFPVKARQMYFPPNESNTWETISPESLGWCEEKLPDLYELLVANGTKSFLVLKDGRIVLEQYFNGHSASMQWLWFSAGKSLRATLVGIAQERGLLNISDPTSDYLGTGWTSLPTDEEASITIRNQLSMTSGLNELFFACITPECLRSGSPSGAGSRWAYHNGPYNLLKEVLEAASGSDLNTLTDVYIEQKIGMLTGSWIPNGNNTFYVSTARDMARFGLLILNRGVWSEQVVMEDNEYFNDMLSSSQALNPSYGYLWWLNGKESHIRPNGPASFSGPIATEAPEDLVLAAGAQGQFIAISPEQNLIMIRQGQSDNPDLAALSIHNEIWGFLSQVIEGNDCESVVTDVPDPANDEWTIYPNPVKDWITVEGVAKSESISLQVKSMTGKTLINSDTNQINVSELPTGLYLLQVNSNEGQITRRILKSSS